jgi:hypothetical protein
MRKGLLLFLASKGRCHSIAMQQTVGSGLMVDRSARKGDEGRDSGRGARDTTYEDCSAHNTQQPFPCCFLQFQLDATDLSHRFGLV